MKEVLEILIKNLVEQKDNVVITETEEGNLITYSVKVDETDMGKVIGKQGRIAKSIRNVMKAVAGKEHKKVNVEFVD
jgi:predicted RNA-binding protein YlqC (UPF0109 family)